MARRCILHLGAGKTGSSSIQDALFFDLRDERFQYLGGGLPVGNQALTAVFCPAPENARLHGGHRKEGSFERSRAEFARRLDRGFRLAERRSADVILSLESMFNASPEGLGNLRDRLEGERLDVEVIVYLRPWMSLVTSKFHQWLKRPRRRRPNPPPNATRAAARGLLGRGSLVGAALPLPRPAGPGETVPVREPRGVRGARRARGAGRE
jgi:hypothetical protein